MTGIGRNRKKKEKEEGEEGAKTSRNEEEWTGIMWVVKGEESRNEDEQIGMIWKERVGRSFHRGG